MTKDNIWVVTALNRNSPRNQHSYVVGLYTDIEDAKEAANIEEMNRGGKYACDINGFTLNKLPEEIIDNEI